MRDDDRLEKIETPEHAAREAACECASGAGAVRYAIQELGFPLDAELRAAFASEGVTFRAAPDPFRAAGYETVVDEIPLPDDPCPDACDRNMIHAVTGEVLWDRSAERERVEDELLAAETAELRADMADNRRNG